MIYLIFLFCVLYLLFAWRRPEWAVMFIIAALPSYLIRFQILGIPFTLLEAMILIAFFVWLVKDTNFLNVLRGRYGWRELKESHKTRMPYPFGMQIILVLVVSYFAVFVAGISNEALGIWKAYFFEPALFFILILNVFGKCHPERSEGSHDSIGRPSGFLRNDNMEKIILSLAVGALAVSVLAIYQKITGNLIDNPLWAAAETRRAVSFFGYPNAVGLYLGPIVMILTGYFFSVIPGLTRDPRLRQGFGGQAGGGGKIFNFQFSIFNQFSIYKFSIGKIFFISVTVFLSLLSIYFAKSIGAIIGLAVAFFVFGIFAGKKMRWATLVLTGAVIIGTMAVPSVRAKVINKISFQDLSGQIRLQQWNETWQMMTASPTRFIFGTGLSGYQRAIAPYHQEGIFFNSEHLPFEEFHRKTVFNEEYRIAHWQPVEIYMYPHNIILNFWTEMGILGVILFGWIIFKFLKIGIWNLLGNWKLEIGNSSKNNFNCINLGLSCAMIVLIIHGLVDVPYFKNDLSILFWLLIAMISLVNLDSKKLMNK